jgi:hypothetical protein
MVMIFFPVITKTCHGITNVDSRDQIAHKYILFGILVKDIEWLFSSHLGVMPDNSKLAFG